MGRYYQWLKSIGNEQKHEFTLFDKIMKDLVTKCLKVAEEKVQISDDDKKIM